MLVRLTLHSHSIAKTLPSVGKATATEDRLTTGPWQHVTGDNCLETALVDSCDSNGDLVGFMPFDLNVEDAPGSQMLVLCSRLHCTALP